MIPVNFRNKTANYLTSKKLAYLWIAEELPFGPSDYGKMYAVWRMKRDSYFRGQRGRLGGVGWRSRGFSLVEPWQFLHFSLAASLQFRKGNSSFFLWEQVREALRSDKGELSWVHLSGFPFFISTLIHVVFWDASVCSHFRFPKSRPMARKVLKRCDNIKQEVTRLRFVFRFSKFNSVNFNSARSSFMNDVKGYYLGLDKDWLEAGPHLSKCNWGDLRISIFSSPISNYTPEHELHPGKQLN